MDPPPAPQKETDPPYKSWFKTKKPAKTDDAPSAPSPPAPPTTPAEAHAPTTEDPMPFIEAYGAATIGGNPVVSESVVDDIAASGGAGATGKAAEEQAPSSEYDILPPPGMSHHDFMTVMERGPANVEDAMSEESKLDKETTFKPHNISAATYKFTSGGRFRCRPTEMATGTKDGQPSLFRRALPAIDPNTPCKACGSPLGTLAIESYDHMQACSKCGARFHQCVKGGLVYGSESWQCPDCLKGNCGVTLPDAFVSPSGEDKEEEEEETVDNRFEKLMEKAKCPSCGHQSSPMGQKRASDDTGNRICDMCGTVYHYHCTVDGKIGEAQIGPPGPRTCPTCLAALPMIRVRSARADLKKKKILTLCPACCSDKLMGVNDGGSQSCMTCGAIFHMCADDKVRYGSPGPLMCAHCNQPIRTTMTDAEAHEWEKPVAAQILTGGAGSSSSSKQVAPPTPTLAEKRARIGAEIAAAASVFLQQQQQCMESGACPICRGGMMDMVTWTIEADDKRMSKWSRCQPEFRQCKRCRVATAFRDNGTATLVVLP